MNTARHEHLVLSMLAVVLASAAVVNVSRQGPEPVAWEEPAESLDRQTRRVEGEGARERLRSTPLSADERIDPNKATADELRRLPRVGPKLAERIIAHREAHGSFRTLADLDAVTGIGPALLAGITPHVALPAAPAQPQASAAPARQVVSASAVAPSSPLELNSASAAELERLPGIGPALAERIVAWRTQNGRFGSVEDLLQVSGIGPKKLERLRPAVRVNP